MDGTGCAAALDPSYRRRESALAVVVVGTAYGMRARNLQPRRAPGRDGDRIASLFTGLALLLAALVSPIDSAGESRAFWVHMVQHLLLGDLAPLAIVLGLTGPILRPVLALPLVGRLRVLAHPLVALPIWTISFYAWHLPALYQAALAHPAIHAAEHLSFFGAGLLIWAAILEPLPGPAWFGNGARAAYVLAVRALGRRSRHRLHLGRIPALPGLRGGERLWGLSPLTDQTLGGAIMFVESATVTLIVFAWLFLRWTREAELSQSLLDTGHGRRAAGRAARYGSRGLTPEPSRTTTAPPR